MTLNLLKQSSDNFEVPFVEDKEHAVANWIDDEDITRLQRLLTKLKDPRDTERYPSVTITFLAQTHPELGFLAGGNQEYMQRLVGRTVAAAELLLDPENPKLQQQHAEWVQIVSDFELLNASNPVVQSSLDIARQHAA